MLESLEGKLGQPRLRPPFPPSFGLYGKPTIVNNVETLANVPLIVANGIDLVPAAWHRKEPRHQDILLIGECGPSGQLRAAIGDDLPRIDFHPRWRHPQWVENKSDYARRRQFVVDCGD